MGYLKSIYLPLEDGRELKISVDFTKGGRSMGTGEMHASGYYVSVTPVLRENKDGYISESMNPFNGFRKHLLDAGRRSAKRAQTAIAIMEEQQKEIFDNYIEHYLPNERVM